MKPLVNSSGFAVILEHWKIQSYLGLIIHSWSLWSRDASPYFPGLLGVLNEIRLHGPLIQHQSRKYQHIPWVLLFFLRKINHKPQVHGDLTATSFPPILPLAGSAPAILTLFLLLEHTCFLSLEGFCLSWKDAGTRNSSVRSNAIFPKWHSILNPLPQ